MSAARVRFCTGLVLFLCLSCDRGRLYELRAEEPKGGATSGTVAGDPLPTSDDRYVLGEYDLADNGIIDGDTIRVDGFQGSLRLLALDTEEVVHDAEHSGSKDRELVQLMNADFPAYVKKVSEGTTRPIKYATPLGDEAAQFARTFLGEAKTLRLEIDEPKRADGSSGTTFGRTLCYVWAIYDGDKAPKLFNLEVIRAGMSPYFTKYGRSRRFDEAFRKAQAEARAAKRGIWDDAKKHYPDYDARLAWWDRRGEALFRYESLKTKLGKSAPIELGFKSAIPKIQEAVSKDPAQPGKAVKVFGLIDYHDKAGVVLHENGATLHVGGDVFIEVEIVGKELAEKLAVTSLFGEFVYIEGVPDRNGSPLKNSDKGRYLRIPVTDPAQLTLGHLVSIP